MNNIKRAIGYCVSPFCDNKGKGLFLLGDINGHISHPVCTGCVLPMHVAHERGESTHPSLNLYRAVFVHFDYDPFCQIYRQVGIVQDDALEREANTYNLYSPLIRAEKRALTVAETLLARLQQDRKRNPSDPNIPTLHESTLDLSDPNYYARLEHLARGWEALAR